MSTSGSTDFTLNSREIIDAALRIIGVLGSGQVSNSDDVALAETHLNLMLKTWSTRDFLALRAEGTQALTQGTASYSIPAAKRVLSVRRRTNNIDVPLIELSREEYFDLPNKTNQGLPNSYYFDPQRSTTNLYIWPVADAGAASATTLHYTYHRFIEDIDALNNEVDLRQDWLETVTYGLASRLVLPFRVHLADPAGAALVQQTAGELFAALATNDQEDASVFFQPQQSY